MRERLINRWTLIAGVLLLLSVTAVACVQLAPSVLPRLNTSLDGQSADGLSPADEAAAALRPTATPRAGAFGASGRQTVAVKRGSISATTSLVGRVAGVEEIPVAFPGLGKVESVPIKPGDIVQEGQLLVQTSAEAIAKDLATAQDALDTDQIRLEQAQAQHEADIASNQKQAATAAQEANNRQQAAIADAQAALTKAQEDQAKVLAGPSDAERRSADVAVTTAHANVQRAEADLAHAQADPDPSQIRAAQRDVANAQNDLDKVTQQLAALRAGPDPVAVTSAERDVQRAQIALGAIQAVKTDTPAGHSASVATAELNLQDAKDRLARLNEPPSTETIAVAKRNVDVAQAALDNARERLDAVKQGAGQGAIDQAQAVLDAARVTEQNAQDQSDALNSHPTPSEASAAAQRVAAAQATLDRVRRQPPTSTSAPSAGASYDLALLQKTVDLDAASVLRLQSAVDSTRLFAPFSGTVAGVNVKVGDTVDTGQKVVTLVKPGDPVVRVELTQKDAAQLSAGQSATFTIDGVSEADAGPLDASLTALNDSTAGPGKVAIFSVAWRPSGPAGLGASGRLIVVTQKHDDVLLVPKKAVHAAGARRYVQYYEGTLSKTANVEVGLTAGDQVEITSGLTEGEIVLVGP